MEIFQFLQSLFSSWMVWVGGILRLIPFLETFVEPWLRQSHPNVEAFLEKHGEIKRNLKAIALICILIGCYRAWVFEHKNAQNAMYGKDGKSEAWAKYNQCDKERAVNDVLGKSCSASLSYQQSRNDGQQDLFNKCLLALGVTNKPQPAVIKVSDTSFDVNMGKDKNGKEYRLWVITVFVDKNVMPLRGTFRCAGNFSVLQGRIAGPNNHETSYLGTSHRLEDGGYRIESVDPAIWQPETPLLFVGSSTDRPTGCKFQLD
jgi:hypothetical protein